MRGLKGLSKLVVVAISAATLILMAAVGAGAASGNLGAGRAFAAVVSLDSGQCHPPKKTHKHGTPGHKHHPCGEDGDDSD